MGLRSIKNANLVVLIVFGSSVKSMVSTTLSVFSVVINCTSDALLFSVLPTVHDRESVLRCMTLLDSVVAVSTSRG